MENAEVITPELMVSRMAENLIGSEIIKLAGEINEKIKKGEKIYNFTIGDFDPAIFPIPQGLTQAIIKAYQSGHTNYPPADGIADLRQVVSEFLETRAGLNYPAKNILIAGGARPLIYSVFQALVDPGDKVLFPVPSWNNNHYSHLSSAKQIFIETRAEDNFMPVASALEPFIREATLVALCSPLNPAGTTFTPEGLTEICDLIIEENKRRTPGSKPLYLMYDQIYWTLTFGNVKHVDPVSLRPEMRNYTIFIDGISKSLAATGVRVGWAFGPGRIMEKMRSILGHIGAWSPKAEQIATAEFLRDDQAVSQFLKEIKLKVNDRLQGIYDGFADLKAKGFPVDAIAPQAAIYLTVKIDLAGLKTPEGKEIRSTKDILKYILDEAGLAIVPFSAFGSSQESRWFRISVGTCKIEDTAEVMAKLEKALKKLSK